MDLRTGGIIDIAKVDSLPESEKKHFVPLTTREAVKLKKMKPEKRAEWYVNEQRRKQKAKAKRRAANKRNKQSRRK